MAISNPATRDSFSGAVKVAVTVVAISFWPAGSFDTSGVDSQSKIWLE